MSKKGRCRFCGEPCYRESIHHLKCLNRAKRADSDYRKWITGAGMEVDTKRLASLLPDRLFEPEAVAQEAYRIGMEERTLRRIVSGASRTTTTGVAEMLREAYGFEAFWPLAGADDWSDLGRYCGDGAPPKYTGCGTFHHPPHGAGLCEECYSREVLGCGPTEPRDVRLAVTR